MNSCCPLVVILCGCFYFYEWCFVLNVAVIFLIFERIAYVMGKVKKEKNFKISQERKNETEVGRKRKNADKKKSSVDESTRKYGYISTNSVISMAESAGFSGIQEDVAKNLAEDVTYRLRYIIQQCKKYMIHSKHKKLSSVHINEVLKMCDSPAIYGYTADKPLHNFLYIKEADIFVLDDEIIDLPSFALAEVLVQKKTSSYTTGVWVKSEDSVLKSEFKIKNSEIKSNNSDVQTNNESFKVSNKNFLHCDKLKAGNESDESETKIPTNLIKYYGITCNTLLGHTELKLIFQDLSNNSRIIPIIPYLLNFITIALNKLNTERQLKRLLQTIEALSKNKNIDFTPYSATTRVINAMLLIVASDKKPTNDFHLRSYAGHVLSLVLSEWCSRDEQRQSIVKKMGKLLGDFKAPPKIHYGAISLLTSLGPDALNVSLWKILKKYINYLEELKLASGMKTGNDSAMIEEVLLNAAVLLYRHPADDLLLHELDGYFYSYFGDVACNLRLNAVTAESSNMYTPDLFGSFKIENIKNGERKPPSKVLKYMNCLYKPNIKKLCVESVFTLPKPRKKKNTRIIFKFAGAIPVPEVNLKRRRFDSQYAQFIAGKESEGHVVVAGKCLISRSQKKSMLDFPFNYLLSVL